MVENANSITALATVHGKKVYFAADIVEGAEGIKEINNCPESTSAKKAGTVDVYKASHHGLDGANNETAMSYLAPKYAVITNSKNCNGTSNARNRILKYTKTSNNIYYTASGTVTLNIESNGNLKFTKASK